MGDEETTEAELNAFLRSVRLVHVQRELVCRENAHYWALAIEYCTGQAKEARRNELAKRKIDYKEILSPEDFAIFAQLRDWRKETAIREAVQLYTVFMNEQLAAMVERRVTTRAGLLQIDGIGQGRVEKYGDAVLQILCAAFTQEGGNETGREPVSPNSGSRQSASGFLQSGQRQTS